MDNLFTLKDYNEQEVINMPATSLAFIGDAYFTLFVRLNVIDLHSKSGKSHKKATSLVKAETQSRLLSKITPVLYEKESDIVRRARNTHTSSKSKNAKLADYKKATAFEALLGYLFLTKQMERINKILKVALEGENV